MMKYKECFITDQGRKGGDEDIRCVVHVMLLILDLALPRI